MCKIIPSWVLHRFQDFQLNTSTRAPIIKILLFFSLISRVELDGSAKMIEINEKVRRESFEIKKIRSKIFRSKFTTLQQSGCDVPDPLNS